LIEHALLVGADAIGQVRGLRVAHVAGQRSKRLVCRDLEGFGCAFVLGVLQQLLLTAVAADHVEWRLAQAGDLTDN
jgi:hypothetical protein